VIKQRLFYEECEGSDLKKLVWSISVGPYIKEKTISISSIQEGAFITLTCQY